SDRNACDYEHHHGAENVEEDASDFGHAPHRTDHLCSSNTLRIRTPLKAIAIPDVLLHQGVFKAPYEDSPTSTTYKP
ncbi:MAG: hypothetical protein ACPHNZ_09685, partial [Ilumatobacteraceae bacterium]